MGRWENASHDKLLRKLTIGEPEVHQIVKRNNYALNSLEVPVHPNM